MHTDVSVLSPPQTTNDPLSTYESLRHEVLEQAAFALRQSHHLALRGIHCDYHEGVLTLRGRLPSFYLKQLAQIAVKDVAEVDEIANQILVEAA